MPQWVVLLAIVAAGWLALAVVGGLLIGRGLRAFERLSRGQGVGGEGPPSTARPRDVRRAA